MGEKPAIRVEPLLAEHAARLFPYLLDAELYRYMPGAPPVTVAALATELRRLCAGSQDASQTWLNWVSFDERGPVSTLQATVLADARAWIAYVVFRPFWGQGYGSQGCRWLLRELFEERGVREVLASVDPRNTASIRVLQAAGLSAQEPREGAGLDPADVVFSLSAERWRSAPIRTRVRA